MRRVALAIALAASPSIAQDAEKGHAQPAHGAEHAQAAAKHGEGHEQAPMPNELLWKFANFAILASGLGYLISKNAGPFFRARTEQIQKGMLESAAMSAKADAQVAEIEKRIANLQVEVDALRRKSGEEIAREGERVRAETTRLIEKMQHQGEAEIALAARNAQQELKAYAANLAVQLAAGEIRQQMTAQDQEQLGDAFVTDIRRKAGLN